MSQGGCTHPRISPEGRCLECGAQFTLAWRARWTELLSPGLWNLVTFILVLVFYNVARGNPDSGGASFIGALLLLYIGARLLFNVLDLFSAHRFFVGLVGRLIARRRLGLFSARAAWVFIGRARFPLRPYAYQHIKEGEEVIIEFFRWSRVAVAIYRRV